MDNSNWSIAKLTLGLLLSFQLLTVGTILLVSYFWGEEAYLKHARGLMKAVATESVQSVENLLLPAEKLIRTSQALMESGVVPVAANTNLERYFFENISENSNFTGMFFGWVNGDFLHVSHSNASQSGSPFFSKYITTENGIKKRVFIKRSADFQTISADTQEDDYDPRKRPWFAALKKGQLQWTNPYLYFTTKIPGITVSIPVVSDSGEPVGVLGLDIEISNLSYFLSKNQLSANSSALIANKDLRVVAHTDIDSMMLADSTEQVGFSLIKLNELKGELAEQALQALTASGQQFVATGIRDVAFDFNDERYQGVFHSYSKSGLGWTVMVASPESDFIGEIRVAQYSKMGVAITLSLFITLCAFLLAVRFLKPVSALEESVLRDALTSLYNRRALSNLGDSIVKKAHRNGQSVSIAMIDIDHFKKINDTYGHPAGDEVLISVSQRMLRVLQNSDMLVRYGGEEFALLLIDAELGVAEDTCERIRQAINADEVLTDAGSIAVTVSAGVVEVPADDDYIAQSLNLADQVLYASKRQGRNCVSTQCVLSES